MHMEKLMEAQTHPTLLAERRTESGKGSARRLRRAGQLPAACYGRDMDSLTLAISLDELEEALDGPKGLNTVFNVHVEGEDLKFNNVILQDYQVEPVSRALLHVDLLVVAEDQIIEVAVPIESVGRAIGERSGGKLRLMRPEIKVRCAASNIPEVITVDVSELGPNDVTMASELDYPEGVEPVFTTDFAIARVMMPRRNVVGLDEVGAPEEGAEAAEGEEAAEAAEGEAAEE
jgi:large subunit ribosomal protein L25